MAERVLVIGPCGAGKSTLARDLARRLGLPLIHMDRLNWGPGWVEAPPGALRARVEAAVSGERWLIDGNYGGTLAPRLARADLVVLLDYPVALCLWRLVRRIARGAARPDMAEGCIERWDWRFLLYVATWRLGPGPRTEARLEDYRGAIIRLRGPRATERWLAGIEAGGA